MAADGTNFWKLLELHPHQQFFRLKNYTSCKEVRFWDLFSRTPKRRFVHALSPAPPALPFPQCLRKYNEMPKLFWNLFIPIVVKFFRNCFSIFFLYFRSPPTKWCETFRRIRTSRTRQYEKWYSPYCVTSHSKSRSKCGPPKSSGSTDGHG